MRVTATVKEETRERILAAARNLLSSKGFDETKTRDIAARARIAVGTLFNYFPSKEALGMMVVSQALTQARADFEARRRGEETLDELLFAHLMAGLRRLAPYRAAVGPIVESGLSPFAAGNSDEGQRVRAEHLQAVAELIADDDRTPAPSFVAMHLYWTLYLGVLAFWSSDESPNQEETLVVLDQSLRLFVSSLINDAQMKEVSHGT